MAPNSMSEAGTSSGTCNTVKTNKTETDAVPKLGEGEVEWTWTWRDIKPLNTTVLIYLHIAGIQAFFNMPHCWQTYLFQFIILLGSGFGVTAGSHRYFTHKSYRANSALRYFLIFLQTLSAQEDIIKWVRDHRVHHKFTDTNADPHNSSRGFFFSHMGWLFIRKHPDVTTFGKKVDMSDLENDKFLLFHKKIYMPASWVVAFIGPICICYYGWGEDFMCAYYLNMLRYILGLHVNWSINSFAHIVGNRPYDKNNSSRDSPLFGFLAFGEGWHNFHHAFPWDYKTGERGDYFTNFSCIFIDFFAWLGWATDLKIVPDAVIKARVLRTGDGSHPYSIEARKKNPNFQEELKNNNEGERDLDHFWGWGDGDMAKEDLAGVDIKHKHYE
ncbi:unnamed protein product [Chironomus riparius]|uniref:Fatty acid desaturase domain-containing protein n=1 Tax=Chironomus riparius TaxID=315576 RepID=A0A9N9S2C8_9DIPT|nr:unnamed protein product [Chironomus riparius]